GHTYSYMGLGAEAIQTHQRYVALAPNEPNTYDSLGLTYQWVGQYDAAKQQFDRALAINPHFEIALIHLAHLHVQLGQYREALRWLTKYVADAPSAAERARGYADMALVHVKQGRLDEAARLADQAARLDGESAWKSLLVALA